MRIALIHALKHSLTPIESSFARLWPDATLMNLLDDSLSADLARDGRLTPGMTDRFLALGRYAASTGANAILQPYFSVYKPSGTGVATMDVDYVRFFAAQRD